MPTTTISRMAIVIAPSDVHVSVDWPRCLEAPTYCAMGSGMRRMDPERRRALSPNGSE